MSRNARTSFSEALLVAVGLLLASCSSLPVATKSQLSGYGNTHDIQLEYPAGWWVEDMSKNYATLGEAEEAGASYIQVFSYNPLMSREPREEFSTNQVKVTVMMRRNVEKLDYEKILAVISDRILEKETFIINGNKAYRVHFWIPREQANGRLDILAIEYLDQDFYVRFICYPWNTMHMKEFEALARSFRYKGR